METMGKRLVVKFWSSSALAFDPHDGLNPCVR
jgi:hypothetical protein